MPDPETKPTEVNTPAQMIPTADVVKMAQFVQVPVPKQTLEELIMEKGDQPEFLSRLSTYISLNIAALQHIKDLCKIYADAEIYGHKNASTVFAAAMKGMAMGLPIMESLDKIRVIHGTPCIRGAHAKALIDKRCPGNGIECIESTAETCTWLFRRDGKEKEFTRQIGEFAHITKEDRQGRNPWRNYPARTLKWNVFGEGAQEFYGDVIGGLYMEEEITGNTPPEEPRQQRSQNSKAPGGQQGGKRQESEIQKKIGEKLDTVAMLVLTKVKGIEDDKSDGFKRAFSTERGLIFKDICIKLFDSDSRKKMPPDCDEKILAALIEMEKAQPGPE